MDYIVVQASSADRLASLVKDKLIIGWELQGGVAVLPEPNDAGIYSTKYQLFQALSKKS